MSIPFSTSSNNIITVSIICVLFSGIFPCSLCIPSAVFPCCISLFLHTFQAKLNCCQHGAYIGHAGHRKPGSTAAAFFSNLLLPCIRTQPLTPQKRGQRKSGAANRPFRGKDLIDCFPYFGGGGGGGGGCFAESAVIFPIDLVLKT